MHITSTRTTGVRFDCQRDTPDTVAIVTTSISARPHHLGRARCTATARATGVETVVTYTLQHGLMRRSWTMSPFEAATVAMILETGSDNRLQAHIRTLRAAVIEAEGCTDRILASQRVAQCALFGPRLQIASARVH